MRLLHDVPEHGTAITWSHRRDSMHGCNALTKKPRGGCRFIGFWNHGRGIDKLAAALYFIFISLLLYNYL